MKTNAFTIKPTDRSLLFDVRLVAVNGVSIGRGGGDGDGDVSGAAGVGVALRRATSSDQVGPVNDASEDGGASFWTFALPKPGEYVVQP